MEDNFMRLIMSEITEGISLKVYTMRFPEKLFKLLDKGEDNNLPIYDLNNTLQSLVTDCAADFIRASKRNDPWIYALSSTCQDDIQAIVANYIEEVWLDNPELYDLKNSLVFQEETISITTADLTKERNPRRKLFMFQASKHVSKKLNIRISTLDSSGKSAERDLKFRRINGVGSSGSVRLMAEMESGIYYTDKRSKELLCVDYAYYLDIYIKQIYGEENPYLYVRPGLLRMRTGSDFRTSNKNIYPYILLSQSHGVTGEDEKIFVRGQITHPDKRKDKNSYGWDFLFRKSFECAYVKMPKVEDLFSSPRSFLYHNSRMNVYVPHGTHFYDAEHPVASGVDLFKRRELGEKALSILEESMDCFGKDLYTEKIVWEREKLISRKNEAKVKLEADCFQFEFPYWTEEFKNEVQSFIDDYNSKDLSSDKKNIELSENRKTAARQIYNMLEGKPKTLELPIGTYSSIKLAPKFISFMDDLKQNPDIEIRRNDKGQKDIRFIMKGFFSNAENLSSSLAKTDKPIAALVEIQDTWYFLKNKFVDTKTFYRFQFAKHNRVTQFIHNDFYVNKKTGLVNSEFYMKIAKCIGELLRMKGVLKVNPEALITKYSEAEEKTIMLGLRFNSSTEQFIMTAVSRQGVLVKTGTGTWSAIDEGLCRAGSSLVPDKGFRSSHNTYFIEESIREIIALTGADHVILMAERPSLKSRIPFFDTMKYKFNLCVSSQDKDNFQVSSKDTSMNKPTLDKLTIVAIDGEQSGLCPEWINIVNGEENVGSLPGPLCKFNDSVFLSISEKTHTSKMMSGRSLTKEAAPDRMQRKETAVMFTVYRTARDFSKDQIAKVVHDLRIKSSIQAIDDTTAYPLPLHLAKKCSEYLIPEKDVYEPKEYIEIPADEALEEVAAATE